MNDAPYSPTVVIIAGSLRRANAAAYCDIPLRTWDDMRARGELPAPCVDRGKAGVWWLREHLDIWNEYGRPDEQRFASILRGLGRGHVRGHVRGRRKSA